MTATTHRAKPRSRPSFADQLAIRLSHTRTIDGLWIGAFGSDAELLLHRIEEALALIKQNDSIQYSRVLRYLRRILVDLLPGDHGCFRSAIQACVLDKRFILTATSTLEMIASTIVHEATHAKLEHCGIVYEEKQRARIEAICFRRELSFTARLPQGRKLHEQVARSLEWYSANPSYFSDENLTQRNTLGYVEAARFLGTAGWVVRGALRVREFISSARRLVRFPRA